MHFKEENVKENSNNWNRLSGGGFQICFLFGHLFLQKKKAAKLNKKENSLLMKSSRQ